MKRGFAMAVLILVAFLGRAADPLDNWHWRAPLPQGYALKGVASGNNLFVAVGELGCVLLSSDGVDWTVTRAPLITNLNAVCFAEDRFVAVGDGGTILTSGPGMEWTQRTTPISHNLHGVSWVNGRYVAVGDGGTILTSSTGSSWTRRDAQSWTNASFEEVAYGNGRFVAVGSIFMSDYFAGIVVTSTDGVGWDRAIDWGLSPLDSIVYADGSFLAVSAGRFASSQDGVYWDTHFVPGIHLWDLAFANGRFFGAGRSGVLTSDDGTNWAATAVTAWMNQLDISAGAGVAVGDAGRLVASFDLIDWQSISSGPDGWLNGLTFGNGRFVGVSGNNLLTSADGRNWDAQRLNSPANLQSVAYGAGVFIAVGRPYLTVTNLVSVDAVSWAAHPIPAPAGLNAIVFANDRFLVVGDEGVVCESADGTNWTTHTIPGASLYCVTYGNGRYLAGGVGGLYASDNLKDWIPVGGSNVNWYALVHGNGMFVAGGFTQFGKTAAPMMRSFDGLTWEAVSGRALHDLAFGGGFFVGAGDQGIVTSSDGQNWVLRESLPLPTAVAVAFGRETFVVSRFLGGIVQSDPIVRRPRLELPSFQAGQFRLWLTDGTIGAAYAIESSANFKDWTQELEIIPLAFPFAIEVQALNPTRLYRAIHRGLP